MASADALALDDAAVHAIASSHARALVKKLREDDASLNYGEVDEAFVRILLGHAAALFLARQGRPADALLDLGSGIGQVICMASLNGMFPRCNGIELVPERHVAARAVAAAAIERAAAVASWELQSLTPESGAHTPIVATCAGPSARELRLVCGDMLQLDWPLADVVFINALVFSEELVARIAARCEALRPGTIVLTQAELPAHTACLARIGASTDVIARGSDAGLFEEPFGIFERVATGGDTC